VFRTFTAISACYNRSFTTSPQPRSMIPRCEANRNDILLPRHGRGVCREPPRMSEARLMKRLGSVMKRASATSSGSCFASIIVLVLVSAACGGQHSPAAPSSKFVVGAGGNFATISDALKLAQPGDTVQVKAGTYAEHVLVTVPGVKLQGDGAIVDGRAGG